MPAARAQFRRALAARRRRFTRFRDLAAEKTVPRQDPRGQQDDAGNEFGIAGTYSLGVGFYVVCALMIIVAGRFSGSAASALGQDEVAAAAAPAVPSIQPTQAELTADIKTDKSPGSTASPATHARADEVVQ
jgi:hypothetical protein